MELVGGERVITGTVRRAYPLQSLRTATADGGASPSDGELGVFGPGVGPCGQDASQLVVVSVDNRTTHETCLVFFYDNWAAKMQFLKRHYKLRISGGGLVALQWEAGMETEERVQCVVVAERDILKKTLERHPRLFSYPLSLLIEVAYEEPLRLPESDQLRYQPSKTIKTRDLYNSAAMRRALTVHPPPKKAKSKRTLGRAEIAKPAYRYTPLAELVTGDADIYGVVVNVSLPKKTGGHDFCMTVSVTDESCPKRSEAIQINVFYPNVEQMPKIKFVGDIIRFHKMKVQQYQDKIQGVSSGRFSRYLVLRGSSNGQLDQQTCSGTWTFEPSDEERARELIKWSRETLASDITLPQGCVQAPRPLAELKFAENFVDLVVRILYVDDSSEPVRLTVWDGSGSATASDPVIKQTLQENGVTVPAHGLLKEVIMSSCWLVVREMGFVEEMRTHWCRFRNLAVGNDEPIPGTAVSPAGREVLRFREVTSFVLLPEFVLDVQERVRLTNDSSVSSGGSVDQDVARPASHVANHSTLGSREVTTIIPQHIQQKVSATMLAEVLSSKQTPRKFHCRARVSGIWPADVDKICKPIANRSGEFIYSFALTVTDSSGSLSVIVYGKDAEHFLHGIPPCDLKINTSSKTLLKQRFAALMKTPQPLHWCIKSYSVGLPPSADGNTQQKAIRYRLFDTLLRCS